MSKLNSLYVSLVALVVAIVALVMSCCGSKDAANVEKAINENPKMIINAMQNYEQQMREEAAAEAKKNVMANVEDLQNNPLTPFVGNPDADVVLVEFFDYSCGYCHRLFPGLKTVMAANPNVKFVFKALTFVSKASEQAARASLAANQQGKFIEMHNALFENKGPLNEARINEIAASVGLDMAKFESDLNSEAVNNALKANAELAGKIQVNGVPAMFLNGDMLQTIDGNVVQQKIDELKK